MSIVSLIYHNNVHIRVDCTRDIMSEMNEYFSFHADGYRFHPLFKQRRWDGRVRLLHASTGMIYRGLLDRVVQFCQDRDYPVQVDERLVSDESISIEETKQFVGDLQFVSKGSPISLRDYQIEAVNHCLVQKRALVVSPTSSGKSAIIAAISRKLQTKFDPAAEKILIIVPNISLVNQFAYDFCDYFSNDIPWLKTDPVHMIFGGKDKETDSPIIVSTYQSLMKLPKAYFEKFACIIVDECHGAEAKAITKVVDNCVNAEYRFGFTGSLKQSKVHVLTLEGMFGKTHTTITTKELMENGQVTELDIKALILKYPEDICTQQRKMNDYKSEVECIVDNEKRSKFIVKLAGSLKGNGLVLVNFVDRQAKPLFEALKASVGDTRPVYYISGETKGDIREEIRLKLDSETDAIIIATMATLSTGVNIPSLQWLIFGSPTKSYTKVLQSIGRILRLHKSKSRVTLYDICDDMRMKLRKNVHENYAFKHFTERLSIYQQQKFDVEIKKVPLFVKE